jgi:hypothetical protein
MTTPEASPRTATQDEQILDILLNFDWERVHAAMAALNWKWQFPDAEDAEKVRVPSISDMHRLAVTLLRYAWESAGFPTQARGGFVARKSADGHLGLVFELADWEYEPET